MVAGVNLLYHSVYVLSLLFGFEKSHRFLKFYLEKDLIESFYDHYGVFFIFSVCVLLDPRNIVLVVVFIITIPKEIFIESSPS